MSHNHNDVLLCSSSYHKEIKATLFYVLILNWAVAILKLVVGYFINSASMIADGYHSFSDGSSNIIGILGMRIASQPKDKDHPYGHKKYETLTSTLIAFSLFLICFYLLHENISKLHLKEAPNVSISSFVVMGIAIAVNISVMLYEYNKGKRLGSDILVADSLHTRADILTSFSVIVAFIGAKLGFLMLDSIVSVFIALFIGYSAIQIFRSSSQILCDTAVIDSSEVEKVVIAIEGVKKCHKIRSRGRADDVHLDLHLLVDDRTPVVKAHNLSSKIENVIKEHFNGVTDVVVHIEPLSSEKDDHDEAHVVS